MSPAERGDGHERDAAMEPRIYVASLSDYNAGRLHGAWISAVQTPDEVHEGIAWMLAASPEPGAEEYAIHDTSGFGPIRLSEYESIEVVATVAAGIAVHGEAFAAWAASLDSLSNATVESFEESYEGEWADRRSYTDEIVESCGVDVADMPNMPEVWRQYVLVDMEAWLRDAEMSGDLDVIDHPGGIWVFRRC